MSFTPFQLRLGRQLVGRDLRARRKVREIDAAAPRRAQVMPRGAVRTLDRWWIGLAAMLQGRITAAIRTLKTRWHARRTRTLRRTDVGPRSADTAAKCLVVGHRGSPVRAMENTLEAMRAAIADEADAVEIDLCLTADGEVVLWHDWDPDETVARLRQLGLEPGVKYAPWVPDLWSEWRRPVDELTLAQLREHYDYKKVFLIFSRGRQHAHLPTIDEFLAWAATEPRLRCVCLDIKVPPGNLASAQRMAAVLRAKLVSAPNVRFIVMSPHETVLHAMRPILGARNYSLDVEARDGDASAISPAIRMDHENGSIGRAVMVTDAFARLRRVVTNDIVLLSTHNSQNPNARVERLLVWTIDDRVEQTELVARGVHGILSNLPRQLRRVVG